MTGSFSAISKILKSTRNRNNGAWFLNLIPAQFKRASAKSATLCILLCVLGPLTDLSAAVPSNIDTTRLALRQNRERRWTIGIPLWIPGYRGQFTVGGVEVGGESGGYGFFDRLFSSDLSLEYYLVMLANYHWRQWNFHLDAFAGNIGKLTTFTLNDNTVVDASISLTMPALYAGYDFLHNSQPLGPITHWQVYLGARIFALDLEVTPPGNLGTKSGDTSWFTFLIGTELTLKISKRLKLKLAGDIGGYTQSTGPTLFGEAYIHYQRWKLISLSIGYMAIRIDGVSEKSEQLQFKANLAGPVVGIAFHF